MSLVPLWIRGFLDLADNDATLGEESVAEELSDASGGLISLALVVILALIFVFTYLPVMRDYREVQAEVVSIHIPKQQALQKKVDAGTEVSFFDYSVKLKFDWEGSQRTELYKNSKHRGSDHKLDRIEVDDFEVGQTLSIFVNPSDPSDIETFTFSISLLLKFVIFLLMITIPMISGVLIACQIAIRRIPWDQPMACTGPQYPYFEISGTWLGPDRSLAYPGICLVAFIAFFYTPDPEFRPVTYGMVAFFTLYFVLTILKITRWLKYYQQLKELRIEHLQADLGLEPGMQFKIHNAPGPCKAFIHLAVPGSPLNSSPEIREPLTIHDGIISTSGLSEEAYGYKQRYEKLIAMIEIEVNSFTALFYIDESGEDDELPEENWDEESAED